MSTTGTTPAAILMATIKADWERSRSPRLLDWGEALERNIQRIEAGGTVTQKALSKVAEKLWECVKEERASTDEKARNCTSAFWNQFQTHLAEQTDRKSISIGSCEELITLFECIAFPKRSSSNPFSWQGAIKDPDAFFGRTKELKSIQDNLNNRQNLQIVGERRIGKSSLLMAVGWKLKSWLGPDAIFAFVDMTNSGCQTLPEWISWVAEEWNWDPAPITLGDFSRRMKREAQAGKRLVLAIDEFDKFIHLVSEFKPEFFENLRACGQQYCSIVTASRVTLKEICQSSPQVSPYFNTFVHVPLSLFTGEEASAFVAQPWPTQFSKDEEKQILRHADRHPLKLRIICEEVAKQRDEKDGAWDAAVQRAREREYEAGLKPGPL